MLVLCHDRSVKESAPIRFAPSAYLILSSVLAVLFFHPLVILNQELLVLILIHPKLPEVQCTPNVSLFTIPSRKWEDDAVTPLSQCVRWGILPLFSRGDIGNS